jgi:hypothetical protein
VILYSNYKKRNKGMKESDRIVNIAVTAGQEAEAEAKFTVKRLTLAQLEAEYISLCGLVAYYGKLVRETQSNPSLYFEGLRADLNQMGADELLMSGDVGPLLAQRKEPILDMIAKVKAMVG